MDEILVLLPQLGAGLALIVATAYSVKRLVASDGEWKAVVTQKDADLDRKDHELARKDEVIARLEATIAELRAE